MTRHRAILIIGCMLATSLGIASIPRPMDLREKVRGAELAIYGVATLDGLPLPDTEGPVKRSCKILVLQTLWPTNQPIRGKLTVDHWVWTRWPDSWWRYNSTTGVFFFERTATALKSVRASRAGRDPWSPVWKDDFLGTNVWRLLGNVGDWYEPTTNLNLVRETINANKR